MLGAAKTMQQDTSQAEVGIGGCLTTASGKAISVFTYGGYNGPGTIRMLVRQARDLA